MKAASNGNRSGGTAAVLQPTPPPSIEIRLAARRAELYVRARPLVAYLLFLALVAAVVALVSAGITILQGALALLNPEIAR